MKVLMKTTVLKLLVGMENVSLRCYGFSEFWKMWHRGTLLRKMLTDFMATLVVIHLSQMDDKCKIMGEVISNHCCFIFLLFPLPKE